MPLPSSDRAQLINPFPGLRPFEPDEDHLFFGREREIDELLRRLRRTRFLAVIGGSGSGKSSLVRCGLIPSLYGGMMKGAGSSWRVAILRPGEDPIGNLAAALDAPEILGREGELGATNRVLLEATLRRGSLGLRDCVRQAGVASDDNILVFVDQFEELFRYKRSRRAPNSHDEAVAFVKLLLDSSIAEGSRVHVALTMRSDYIDECLDYPGLPEAINNSQYLVPRMTRDQLRSSITGPVAVSGGDIARRLVVRLLNEVGDDPDQLPVLQHALMRTFAAWQASSDEGPIDIAQYEAAGTMAGALSKHADEAYGELESTRERELAASLFKALTDAGTTGRGVRRPTSVAELAAVSGATEEEVVSVAEPFRRAGRSFLTPAAATPLTGRSILDLSHESLMRCWRRLIEWADEERRAASSYRLLSRAAARYEEGTGSLWRDPELELGLQFWARTRPTAAWAGHIDEGHARASAFLDASRRARDRARRNRRLVAGGALAATLTAALAIGWLGLRAQRSARQVRANSLLLAARSADDPLMMALLVPAIGAEPPQGTAELRPLVDGMAIADFVFRGHERGLTAVTYDPAGTLIATGSEDGIVLLWSPDGAGTVTRLQHDSPVKTVAFNADGSRLVAGYADGTASLWQVAKPGEPVALRGHTQAIEDARFSPDGSLVVTASLDGSARLWSDSGVELQALAHDDWVRSAVFDSAGTRILTASADGYARLWDLDGAALGALEHPDKVTSAVFQPGDDTHVLTASNDGVARLWSLDGSTGPRNFLVPGGGPLRSADFDPHGERIVTAGEDGATRVWRVDGALDDQLMHGGPVVAATFGPDGSEVLVAAGDGGGLWNVEHGGGETVLRGHGAAVVGAAYSPDGRHVATASADKTARIWSAQGAGEPRVFRGGTRPVTGAAFSPATDFPIVTASIDATARLWATDGNEQRVFEHPAWVRSAAFSPDGSAILTAANDGLARVWALDRPETPTLIGRQGKQLRSAAYSPDGASIMTLDEDGVVVIEAIDGGGEPELLTQESGAVWAGFTPDGSSVLIAAPERIVIRSADGTGAAVEFLPTEERPNPSGHSITSADISPDGSALLTASADGRARLWNLQADSEPLVLDDGRAGDETRPPVTHVAFSPDGRRAAAASGDGVVRIWNVETPAAPIDVLAHGSQVNSLRFSGDGSTLLTASADGAARLWRIGWDALVDYLRTSTRDCLPRQQRIRLLGESEAAAEAAFVACEKLRQRGTSGAG